MTTLNCKVASCAHYKAGCCALPAIHVTGANASVSNQTSCSSYQEKGKGCCAPVNHQNSKCSRGQDIRCEAQLCQYNCQGGCSASSICVDTCGAGSACTCSETECSTFNCK